MGTNCLIWCGVVLLVADDQRSFFMTNGHLPPVGHVCPLSTDRLSLVHGSLRLLYPDTMGVLFPPLGGLLPMGGTRLSVIRGLLHSLYLNSLGVFITILSNTFGVWSIQDVQISIFVNNHRQSYVGSCEVYYGWPSNFRWKA